MESGYIDSFDIKRITKAVEEEFEVEQIEKGKYAVSKPDKNSSHVTDLRSLYCSCDDYKYNCAKHENKTGDEKYCKHLFHCMFRVHNMV